MEKKPTHLRVATSADEPVPVVKPETPESITAALDGSARGVLAAMRETLAKQLDAKQIAGNSIASAMRELRELDRLIRVEDAEAEAEGKRSGDSDQGRSFNSSAI